MKKIVLFFSIFLWISLSGCQVELLVADKLPWTGEEKILYRDSFSTKTGGWRTYEDSLSLAEYYSGGFRLKANVPHYQFISVPGLNFANTQIYAHARKLGGPDDNLFGILCRFQDSANYYALVIGSDGYYGIYKVVSGRQMLIWHDYMDFSENINRGGQENALMAICQDDQLALFVNDNLLLQVEDNTFSYGDVGLIVGNFSEPGVDVLFDDFIVVKP